MITEIVPELIDVLKKNFNTDLMSVVLFGSIVNGTSTATSDIDVLVVSGTPMKDWRARDKLILDLNRISISIDAGNIRSQ
jgi:predicted nucleotidyltransferase